LGAWVLAGGAAAYASQAPEEDLLAPSEKIDITGRGSIGASGGGMVFLSGQDFGDGGLGKTRLIGHAIFKYNFTPSLAGVAETGWGWNTYSSASAETIAVIVPTTLGVEYRFAAGGKFWPHAAAGGGLYWIGIKDTPDSYASAGDDAKKLKWMSPGIYGKIGTEYLFNNGISINLDFLYHHVFSSNENYAFTRSLDPNDYSDPADYQRALALSNSWGLQNTSFGELRIGINYYFAFKQKESAPENPPGEKK